MVGFILGFSSVNYLFISCVLFLIVYLFLIYFIDFFNIFWILILCLLTLFIVHSG